MNINFNNNFEISNGSSSLVLDDDTGYLTYENSTLTASASTPSSNDLFDFSIENDVDVYAFKEEILYVSDTPTDFTGLFTINTSLTKKILFKDLTVKVISKPDSLEGYIIANFDDTTTWKSSINLDNCHVVFEVPESESITTPGLIGDYFCTGGIANECSITNCSFNRTNNTNISIIDGAGGICGDSAAYGNGTSSTGGIVSIQNCYSIGNITGDYAGGICGAGAAYGDGGTVTIENCYHVGNIGGEGASGICGYGAANGFNGQGGTVSIKNCYSIGDITGDYAGGICGADAAVGINSGQGGTVTIQNCYSIGDITGIEASGICGAYAAVGINTNTTGGTVTIQNCYSIGDITGIEASGICGAYAASEVLNGSSGTVNIENCYNVGNIDGGGAGGICGSYAASEVLNGSSGTVNIQNCYSVGTISSGAGGICGSYAAASGTGADSLTINCCYVLTDPNVLESAGALLGSNYNSTTGVITVSNSYYSQTLSGVTENNSPLGSLTAILNTQNPQYCNGYEDSTNLDLGYTYPILSTFLNESIWQKRCLTDGGNTSYFVLVDFLDCNFWLEDTRCLDEFAPETGYSCPDPIGNNNDKVLLVVILTCILVPIIILIFIGVFAFL